jgi:hypothetical protein
MVYRTLGHAVCRYETAKTGETLTVDLTVIPTEGGTFDNTVYLQYVMPQRGNEGRRIDEEFSVTVLPAQGPHETSAEGAERGDTAPAPEGAQEPADGLSWWRRIFGG